MKERWALTTPTWARPSTTLLFSIDSRAATPTRSNSTGVGQYLRNSAGREPPPFGDVAPQPRRALPRAGPIRRRRATLQALAGDPRKAPGPDHETVSQPQRLGGTVSKARSLCRRRAAPQARAGHQGKGTRRRPSLRGYVPQQPCRTVSQQGRYTDAEPFYRRALAITERARAPTTLMSAPGSTTWLRSMARRAGPSTRNGCTNVRWPSVRRRSAPTTQSGHVEQQSRLCLSTAGPERRGRPLYKRALAIREKVPGPTTPKWARRSTTSLSSIDCRAGSLTPSHSTGARWRSVRRRWAPTTPAWPIAQQPRLPLSRAWAVCRRRPALQAFAGDSRKGAGPGPPRCGRQPQQPGLPLL